MPTRRTVLAAALLYPALPPSVHARTLMARTGHGTAAVSVLPRAAARAA